MQTQLPPVPRRDTTATAPRLTAGELVVAVLDLLIGGAGAWIAFDLLIKVGDSPIYLFPGSTATLAALGALLASLLIFLRQRRLAVYAQWLSALGALAMCGVTAWSMFKNALGWESFLFILPVLLITVVFAWFAWFLKSIDESK